MNKDSKPQRWEVPLHPDYVAKSDKHNRAELALEVFRVADSTGTWNPDVCRAAAAVLVDYFKLDEEEEGGE